MRLTGDLIQERALQTIDPDNQRAMVLRGYKISLIENLGTTRDMYGCIDLSENEISRIENIPKLVRLKTLLLANNAISRIASDAFDSLPELKSLVLSNNRISRLATLLPIGSLKRLERLSLIYNPVCRLPHYREFLIHLMGYSRTFRFLDFERITDAERHAAKAFFATQEGTKLLREIVPEQYVPEDHKVEETEKVEVRPAFSDEVLQKIQVAIMEATDMDVVNKLERALKTGQLTPEISAIIGMP